MRSVFFGIVLSLHCILPPPTQEGAPEPTVDEACLDAWLSARGLDAYGHPSGTVYAGGAPLTVEAGGATNSRAEYVLARHPEAGEACLTPPST